MGVTGRRASANESQFVGASFYDNMDDQLFAKRRGREKIQSGRYAGCGKSGKLPAFDCEVAEHDIPIVAVCWVPEDRKSLAYQHSP